jgi:hypothetical protein
VQNRTNADEGEEVGGHSPTSVRSMTLASLMHLSSWEKNEVMGLTDEPPYPTTM